MRRIIGRAILARDATLRVLDGAGVYLLHFDTPMPRGPGRHARHYLGWAECLGERLTKHAQGRGARLTQVAASRGISWQVAMWPERSRSDEARLKHTHNTPRYCPYCQHERRARHAS